MKTHFKEHLFHYSFWDALVQRRSRRFGKGMALNGGPLAYQSAHSPEPLTLEEESALAFAGSGLTGYALAELPYQTGSKPDAGSGNIMIHFLGRTVASGDALHYVILFVINDDGVWMMKRPQDFPRQDIPELLKMQQAGELVQLYERSRVKIADGRADIPREMPFVLALNKWSANVAGTTYFLPVNEFSTIYINVLLTAFNEEFGYFLLDERNRFQPAGLAKFGRSRGGHLYDDPGTGRVATINVLETWFCEFGSIEQGGMLQNLALMAQALGLGGFPHFAAHPFIWFQTLGFRMQDIPFSRTIGAGPVMKTALKMLKKETGIPTALGLERDGDVLIKPFCPPYYRNMEEAVLAFIDYKYEKGKGTFRDGGATTGWKDGAKVQDGIPQYSDQNIAATIAYCEYVFNRYGRFPALSGPFRTVLAYQAHHLDLDFYQKFYRTECLSETQQQHSKNWHE